MLHQIISAGFGGQGILFLGDLLAESALKEGRYVTYLPTYGVAMRGGTANCVVTMSDEEIGSALLDRPDIAIIMNEQSFVKFQPMVQNGGLIVANSSIIDAGLFTRSDEVRIVWVPATETARVVAGTERAANMTALGGLMGAEPVVKVETIEAILHEETDPRKQKMIENNLAAMRAGMEFAKT